MKKKLIILGCGFAGFSLVKRINPEVYDLYLISPRNHFLFTPLLPSTTVGTIEFRSIIEPVRNLKYVNYYQAYCTEIKPYENKIVCEDSDSGTRFELDYDILVISVGELTNTYNISGVREYACFLRELNDARKIRTKVIDCFENASLPGLSEEKRKAYLRFIVCGGGPTGVEFAAELHDFIEEDVKKKYKELADITELILIEASDKILSTFDSKLSEYTLKNFRRQKIKVMLNSYITQVTPQEIILKDGRTIKYGLLVWSAGNAPADFVLKSSFRKSERGKILVDEFLRVEGYKNIFAIGDCADNLLYNYPSTGQTAQQQGKYLAKQLNRLSENKQPLPFRFRDFGMLAYIGSRKSLANTSIYKGSGFITWLFWRSVYITKLVSIKNKILVLFDWFKNFLFGRDVSNF
ncbi:MAG: FAD-dependent oxidoreductase [Ignavibacteria bacterium]|nr:FAD-dependent oxidoreductase [Ignavibacteria bacterium]